MWLRFLPLLAVAPLSLIFPFHMAISAVALFGVWHVLSELDYFSSQYRIFRRRKSFRPILFLGAALLSATILPFSFAEVSNARASRIFFVLFYIGVALWLLLTVWGKTRGKAATISLLSIAITLPIIAVFKPLLLAFLLIHLHNVTPWLFHCRKQGGWISVLTAVFWGAIFPVGCFAIMARMGIGVTEINLPIILERDLFEHVIPDLWPWDNPVTLLSFFAYQQLLHYLMWIWIIPAGNACSALPGSEIFPELSFFAGFKKLSAKKGQVFALLLIAGSLALFTLFAVEWRRIYFAIAQFHVLLELPLIWLTVDPHSAQ
ncbi:MAG: hypothetical protein U1F16_06745 [Turneriella sp.]